MSKKKKKKNKKPQKTRQDFGYSEKADNKEIFRTQDQVEDEAKEDKESLPTNEEKEGFVWRVLNKIVISIIETLEFINEKWGLIVVSIILMVVLGVYLAFGTEGIHSAIEYIKKKPDEIVYAILIIIACSISYMLYKGIAESINDWLGKRFNLFNKTNSKHLSKTFNFIKKQWVLILISIILLMILVAFLTSDTKSVHDVIYHLVVFASVIITIPFAIIPFYLLYIYTTSFLKEKDRLSQGVYITICTSIASGLIFYIIQECNFNRITTISLVSIIYIAFFGLIYKSILFIMKGAKGCLAWGCIIHLLLFIIAMLAMTIDELF